MISTVNHPCPCSISAQSNFAVGAVVNASFGSITELTFYITALLRGHQAANPCLQEVVKSTLTGTLLGCTLFIPVSPSSCYDLQHLMHIFQDCLCGSSVIWFTWLRPGRTSKKSENCVSFDAHSMNMTGCFLLPEFSFKKIWLNIAIVTWTFYGY